MFAKTRIAWRLLIAAAALPTFLSAASAQAIVCGPHQQLADLLGAQYHEVREGMGLSKSGTVMEVFTSPAGTWTIVRSAPDGTACIVDAGEAWAGSREARAAGPGIAPAARQDAGWR